MTEHTGDTTILNTLIGTLLDSVEGYRDAAEDVDNAHLKQLFLARANERTSVAGDLRAAVSALGAEPTDDATLLGGAHRMFLSLKDAITGQDDKAIVNEVERGEDYLKAKFETAMGTTDLGAQARTAIEAAWTSVRAGHDEMRNLKHSLEA